MPSTGNAPDKVPSAIAYTLCYKGVSLSGITGGFRGYSQVRASSVSHAELLNSELQVSESALMLLSYDSFPMYSERINVSATSHRRQDATSQSPLEFHKSTRQLHRTERFAVVGTTTARFPLDTIVLLDT